MVFFYLDSKHHRYVHVRELVLRLKVPTLRNRLQWVNINTFYFLLYLYIFHIEII